ADEVTWTVADSAALPSLLATGRVDAVGQYVVGEPLLEKNVAPKSLVRLAYADVGLNYYGNGIIATEETIQNRPDLVRAFVEGTICGMKAAFADPAEAGRIMHEYHRQVEPEIGAGETEIVRDLAQVDDRPLGAIDPERIESTVEVVSDAYDLKTSVAPDDMYAPGFVPE
ncbi:MAG: ABC transporter substrate-binding protein, partial [Acidimicrobiia bacterium]|nr:ABC transporter substrate-binding protein [Acidimicrobiia bacterium]